MDDVVAAFADVRSAGAFWLALGALLTDEVVLDEAQTAGMDWPDLEDGRRRLVNTRRTIVATAVERGWISGREEDLLGGPDAHEALAAARPWIEREQRRRMADVSAPEGQ
jgi:hypothetical protein